MLTDKSMQSIDLHRMSHRQIQGVSEEYILALICKGDKSQIEILYNRAVSNPNRAATFCKFKNFSLV